MAISTLDARTALIVIDLQRGIAVAPKAHPVEDVIANAKTLVDTFHEHSLPVVFVTVSGGAPGRTEQALRGAMAEDWDILVDGLGKLSDDAHVVKRTWGAFHNTDLDDILRGHDVTQVVLSGISTSAGVESTARAAHERGYNVTLAVDAMTDATLEAHNASVTLNFPRLGETGSTADVVNMLASRTA